MRYTRGVHDSDDLQLDVLGAEVVEQADTRAEQHRHKVDLYFVEQPSSKALADGDDVRSLGIAAVQSDRLQHTAGFCDVGVG